MLSFLKKIFGTANDRMVKKLRSEVQLINSLEDQISQLSDIELKNKTEHFRKKIADTNNLDTIIHEAFAVVREASKRILGQRHFDEQIIGGLVLHKSMVAEMRTGEGKTLVATLPGYLNALSGKGVHIVTVNDYLVQRDSQWMKKVFEFLGLSVGCITSNMAVEERKHAYRCDITYATNNELGFDYLKDNMRYSTEAKVQRPLHYAIIDEIDSVLIDESRTPLIISGPVDQDTQIYYVINQIISKITTSDFDKDEKLKTIVLNDQGIDTVERLLTESEIIKHNSSLFDFNNIKLMHYINQALKAHFFFFKDKDYMIQDNQVMIIDEFTGRIMDGRRYSDGLHQAIEAKENVQIQNENQTLASITYQNYFRMYEKLSGMTGTAMTEAAELKDIYNLDVVSIPTHKKIQRIDHDDEIYGTKQEKYESILSDIKTRNEKQQPILIGTVSIEKSEELSQLLKSHNIKHNVLNAKYHEQEAYIIAQAGKLGAVTIATNMAGRGTDIQLGGNAEMLAQTYQTNDINNTKTFEEIEQEIENEKQQVKEKGGLYVLCTERHESRRIDNQLRGRSGRQGDPGETKFYLSLEDDLMKIFASDKISSILRTLGLKNGEAIYHPMINRSIEKAQQKVESHNYEIRKNLLRFDDVMNEQRKAVYQQRDDIITATDIDETFSNMLDSWIDSTIGKFIPKGSFKDSWELDDLSKEVHRVLSIDIDIDYIKDNLNEQMLKEYLHNKTIDLYNSKREQNDTDIFIKIGKYIMLNIFDQLWKNHLHTLDQLKHGIHLRAYGQKNPLHEYKKEAFAYFEEMIVKLEEMFLQEILLIEVQKPQTEFINSQNENSNFDEKIDNAHIINKKQTIENNEKYLADVQNINNTSFNQNDPNTWHKVRRNAMCPCGSNKKYKQCHGSYT